MDASERSESILIPPSPQPWVGHSLGAQRRPRPCPRPHSQWEPSLWGRGFFHSPLRGGGEPAGGRAGGQTAGVGKIRPVSREGSVQRFGTQLWADSEFPPRGGGRERGQLQACFAVLRTPVSHVGPASCCGCGMRSPLSVPTWWEAGPMTILHARKWRLPRPGACSRSHN